MSIYSPDVSAWETEMMFHDCIMKYHVINAFTVWQGVGDEDKLIIAANVCSSRL
jgi:hypothetical protein